MTGQPVRRAPDSPPPLPVPEEEVRLSPAMEDYIEAIYRLAGADGSGSCTNSAIADALRVKRPSVSKALKRLSEAGFVTYERYSRVTLTAKGHAVARQQVRLHSVLMHFLVEILQLPEELAEHDACLMEHAISRPTVERLVEFIERFDQANPGELPQLDTDVQRPAGQPPARRSWTSRV